MGEGDLRTTYTFDFKDMGLRKIGSYREISAAVKVIDKKGQNYTGPPATSSVRFIKREEQVAQKMGYKVLEKYALILFAFNGSDLREQNRAIVEQIVERMGQFPTAEVKVVGHTDNIDKEVYNMWLSEKRTKSRL
ncbi:MAG: OmpA family protein [Desulfatiglandales bacterium]|nr:OmpA family protein [Desulfatiglandales bacterium]